MKETNRSHERTKEGKDMSGSIVSNKLTRRTFLKAAATTTAVAAVGDKLFGGPVTALVEGKAATLQSMAEDVVIPSCCFMCFSNCGILAHRVDGVVVKVEGNPEHPYNQGKTCARSQAALMKLYNPFRIKAPLKRTNPEKGRDVDPQWVEVTWAEALTTVGDRLAKIHAEDPRKLLVMSGWGSRFYGGEARKDIARAFATPNDISGPGGMTCAAAWHNIGYLTNGTMSATGMDYGYCHYLLTVGGSIGINKGDPETAREFWKAKERGMKFVVVDTRLSAEAAKADEWVPIRGGTDLAFLLALNNVLLYELNQYDVDFIKLRTNGPYLIRSDNGQYMRSSTDMLPADATRKNQELGKPYIWDPADNKAKLFDDPTIQDWALEGTYTVEGVECKPGFVLMKEQMREYTPEWAQGITTIPAETIRRIASELLEAAMIGSTIVVDGVTFPYRPVAVNIGRGGQTHKYGTIAVEAACQLDLLLGSAETPGGNVSGGVIQETGVDGTNKPKGTVVYRPVQYPPDYALYNTYWPACYKTYWATWDAVLNPERYGIDYELEALVVNGANPIFGFGSPDLVTEAIKKIPFVFAISYHLDEPTELADIVFPDPGFTEWLHDVYGVLRQPLVDKPLYDTRPVEETYAAIFESAGLLADWNRMLDSKLRLKDPYKLDPNTKYTQAEILDRAYKSSYGEEFGLAWFMEHGLRVRPAAEREAYGYYHNPQTRYHLYHEFIKWAGEELRKDMEALGISHPYPDWEEGYQPLPYWKANPTLEAPAEFDLFENNFRTSLMSMGFSPDNPWTYEAMQFDPYPAAVWIHRDTAKKKGLKDGDLVWVESYVQEPWARVKGEILTSEGIHPESCIIGGQWGRWAAGMNAIAKEGPHHNSLLSIKLEYVDHFSGNIEMGSRVKIYRVAQEEV